MKHGYPWLLVATLFCCAALNYGDRTAVSSVFPLLRRDFGMSDVELGAIGSFFLLSYACGSPFAGLIADRFSRSRLVVYSLLAWSLVTAATAFVTSGRQLLAARVLLGLSECLYLPASITLIADYHRPPTRAVAMGVHVAGLSFGMIAGGTLGGYIGQVFGWRVMFLVLGCAGVVMAGICRLVLADRVQEKPVERATVPMLNLANIRRLASTPTYLIIISEAALLSIGSWVFFNWLPLFYQEAFHMSLAGAGFSGTFMIQAAAVIGSLLGGQVSDMVARTGLRRRMLLQGICLFCAVPFCLAFIWPATYATVSAAIFLYALGTQFAVANEHPILCDVLDPKLRGTAIGCMNTTSCLAAGSGVLLTGFLKGRFDLAAIFGGASGLTLIAALLVLIGYKFFIALDLSRRAAAALEAAPAEALRS